MVSYYMTMVKSWLIMVNHDQFYFTMVNHRKILFDHGQELWQWLTMIKLMVYHCQDHGQSLPTMIVHGQPSLTMKYHGDHGHYEMQIAYIYTDTCTCEFVRYVLSVMVLQFIDQQERNKKTIIEPQHISKIHRKLVPELYEVVQHAWGKQCEFAMEAVKELFVLMETYSQLIEVIFIYYTFM